MRFVSVRGGLLAEGLDWRVVERGESEYPGILEHLDAPPERLWVVGRSLTTFPPAVAVVGTRTPTPYGQEIAHELAADFVRSGMCVVSGMARGIDAWAHAGALDRGTTIAVMAGGVDRCYPSSNRLLYEEIAEHGALVSEMEPGTPTHKRRFPIRNRIIAGLSLAVVVVQAGLRSGATTTARHAAAIGREVFAVPGDVRVEVSAGVHELLRDGAGVCASAGDVLERIAPEIARARGGAGLGVVPHDLPEEQRRFLEALGGQPGRAEAVARAAQLDGAALARTLVSLELDGYIDRAPGGVVRRLR